MSTFKYFSEFGNFCINDSSDVEGHVYRSCVLPTCTNSLVSIEDCSVAATNLAKDSRIGGSRNQSRPAVTFLNERVSDGSLPGETSKATVKSELSLCPIPVKHGKRREKLRAHLDSSILSSLTFFKFVESGNTARRVPFNVLELENSRVSLNDVSEENKQFTAINLVNERVAEVKDASLLRNLSNFTGHVMRDNVQGVVPCLAHFFERKSR